MMKNTNREFKIIKFSTGNEKTVYMLKINGDIVIEVDDEVTGKAIFSKNGLTEVQADMLYNKCCFDYGIGEGLK